MKYWFTADLHLGHKNIIKYCNRPYESINEMDEDLIHRWNQRVNDDDIVIVNGDFCFGGKRDFLEYVEELLGSRIYIQGNHDSNNMGKAIIYSMKIKHGGKKFNIVHNPRHVNFDYKVNLVGHIHNNWKFAQINKYHGVDEYGAPKITTKKLENNKKYHITNCINIGVDVWDFKPVDINEILKEYGWWLKSKEA